MDPLDILWIIAEVGRMVDFVLEELCVLVSGHRSRAWREGRTCDAGDFVAYKIGGLVLVMTRQQEVFIESPS